MYYYVLPARKLALRYSWEYRNVVYYDKEECNGKIELRMCL